MQEEVILSTDRGFVFVIFVCVFVCVFVFVFLSLYICVRIFVLIVHLYICAFCIMKRKKSPGRGFVYLSAAALYAMMIYYISSGHQTVLQSELILVLFSHGDNQST